MAQRQFGSRNSFPAQKMIFPVIDKNQVNSGQAGCRLISFGNISSLPRINAIWHNYRGNKKEKFPNEIFLLVSNPANGSTYTAMEK